MLKVTLSTQAGKTITTDVVSDAVEFAWRHAVTGRWQMDKFEMCLQEEIWGKAGEYADWFGLNFAIANAPRETYTVPVDPADATNCEACQ